MCVIIFTQAPQHTSDPAYVQEAFVGLRVEAEGFCSPEEAQLRGCPNGAYMVALSKLLRAMRTQNVRAYEFLAAQWGNIQDVATSRNEVGILLPFPAECCEPIGTIH